MEFLSWYYHCWVNVKQVLSAFLFIKPNLREPAAPKSNEITPKILQNNGIFFSLCGPNTIWISSLASAQKNKPAKPLVHSPNSAHGLAASSVSDARPYRRLLCKKKRAGAISQPTGWESTHRSTALPSLPTKPGALLPSSQEALFLQEKGLILNSAATRLPSAEL